mmetsp:Transcript_11030/g.32920  ORF Transcript_11030/g.32920 Transcript_11030/m.32920 type:complete len:226 (-) Transcript_11030:347-1024(-)
MHLSMMMALEPAAAEPWHVRSKEIYTASITPRAWLGDRAVELGARRVLLAEGRRHAGLVRALAVRRLGVHLLQERDDVVPLRAARHLEGRAAVAVDRARVHALLDRQVRDDVEVAPVAGLRAGEVDATAAAEPRAAARSSTRADGTARAPAMWKGVMPFLPRVQLTPRATRNLTTSRLPSWQACGRPRRGAREPGRPPTRETLARASRAAPCEEEGRAPRLVDGF